MYSRKLHPFAFVFTFAATLLLTAFRPSVGISEYASPAAEKKGINAKPDPAPLQDQTKALRLGAFEAVDNLRSTPTTMDWRKAEGPVQKSLDFFKLMSEPTKVPDSLLHDLRLLASSANCVGSLAKDHDKTQAGLSPTGLIDISCEIINLFNTLYNFQIYDYAMYTMLSSISQQEGHEAAFNEMLEQVQNATSNYCLIGKQIWLNAAGGVEQVTFRVAIQLPDSGEFEEVDDVLVAIIQKEVEKAMYDKYVELGGGIIAIVDAELEGMNKLEEIIKALIAGTYNVDLTELTLQKLEFFPVVSNASVSLIHGTIDTTGNVHDYAGLMTSSGALARDEMIGEITKVDYSQFSIRVIITDDLNYVPGSNSYFSAAANDYKNATEEVVFWIHYHTPTSDTQPGIPYMKTRNNLSIEKANSLVETYWAKYREDPTGGSGGSARPGGGSCPCPNFDFALNWRAHESILSCIDDVEAMTCVGGLGPFVAGVFDSPIGSDVGKYQAGLVCGVVDGVLDQANFLYGIATGIVDFTRYGLHEKPHLIFTPNGTAMALGMAGDVIYKLAYRNAIEVGWNVFSWDLGFNSWDVAYQEHKSEATEFWDKLNQIYDGLTNPESWKQLVTGMIGSFESWLGNISGVNGAKEAGYTHGQEILEILLDIVTAGTAVALTVGKDVLGDIYKTIKSRDLGVFLKGKYDSLPDLDAKAKCKMLGLGCFVAGTLVHTSLGVIPIEQLNPFIHHTALEASSNLSSNKDGMRAGSDYVLTYHHKGSNLLSASFSINQPNVVNTMPASQQEPWQWVSLKIVSEAGEVVTANLRRPSWWLIENNIQTIGSSTWISLPEMNVSGLATAIGFIPSKVLTNIDTFAIDSKYVYQPITGWFERSNAEVWDFAFSSGDIISATPEHLFFSEDKQKYVAIGSMDLGERVKSTVANDIVLASKKKREDDFYKVYNLEVLGDHNYHIGESPILVHNAYPNFLTIGEWLSNPKINGYKPQKFDTPNWRNNFHETNNAQKHNVFVNEWGFPDFREFVPDYNGKPVAVRFDFGVLNPDDQVFDIKTANKKIFGVETANFHESIFPGYTWHHHEDARTLMLVPSTVNNGYIGGIPHTGGVAIMKHNKSNLNSPEKWLKFPLAEIQVVE